MKTGEASKILGVDARTIKNWIDNPSLRKFFSPSAKGEHGSTHRLFTESDILVLNTIRMKRSEGESDWDVIANYLEEGSREQEFPANAISVDTRTIPMPQAEQSAKAMATMAERDAALKRVQELEVEVERLRSIYEDQIRQIREQHKAEVEQLRGENTSIREQLLREISKLNREIGRLEGQMQLKQDDDDD